jgi:hypothetical protein
VRALWDGKEIIMKIITVVIALVALRVVGVGAQPRPDLSSADPTKREESARALAAQTPLTADARTALVDLLAREKGLTQPVFPASKATSEEGYAEYYAWLIGEVMKIADEEPDRTDVWRALLAADPGEGYTAYGEWLGKHGDKTFPYLIAYARDHRTDSLDTQNRSGALTSLAQIVAYERLPEKVHHISAADLQTAESAVRDGLVDPDPIIRSASVLALQIIGDPKDLPVLEQIALTDDYVTHDGPPSGAEIYFPVRQLARTVVERMRARLAANPNAN